MYFVGSGTSSYLIDEEMCLLDLSIQWRSVSGLLDLSMWGIGGVSGCLICVIVKVKGVSGEW